MTDFLPKPLEDGEDQKLLDELDLGDAFSGDESRFQMSDTVQVGERSRVLVICVVVSLLLHFGLAFAIPRLIGVPHSDSFLKNGEEVQPVRLVQQPAQESKPEPPPDNASAISDRNHVTEKERMPKALPADKPPLGTMESQEKRMASLTPPPAPEDFEKTKEEPKQKEEAEKPENSPKPSTHQPPPKNDPDKHRTKDPVKRMSSKKHPRLEDLTPTHAEMKTAMFGPPGGAQDFDLRGDVEEAVVDWNTREDRFYSYLIGLKTKIQGVWVYPSVAAKSGIGGQLIVEFSIAKNGQLLGVNLLDSSGRTILDESAMNAIRSAAPYNPFPESIRAKRLRIRANFIYITQNFFGRN